MKISDLTFLPPPVVPSDEEPMDAGGRQVQVQVQAEISPPPVCRRMRNRWLRADGDVQAGHGSRLLRQAGLPPSSGQAAGDAFEGKGA
jgi:hypothetical protein